jgi:succinylglutamate desuccinylase
MDKDKKYSLRACNIRLDASKALGLVEYYQNKRLLSKQLLDDKIMAILENKKFSQDKKLDKIKTLQETFKKASDDFQKYIDDNTNRYKLLIRSVSPPPSEGTSEESAEEQV